jgi:2-polyprenyl-3-methyl-5-hydroxy-6-metoxy-1,4-benzoquinol methylase
LDAVAEDLGVACELVDADGLEGDPRKALVTMADARLKARGCLLVYSAALSSEASLAAFRNALWPDLYVVTVYLFEQGRPPECIGTWGRRRLAEAPASPGAGYAAVVVRREDAMHPDAIKAKFNSTAGGWNGEPGAPSYGHFRWMRRIIADLAEPGPGQKVLDAGCGAGWVGIEAALKGAEVSSFDPSPEMVRNASENANRENVKLEVQVGFTESPPFEGPFDIVISAGVISFSPDQVAFLDGLDSVLKAGGRLAIADLNPGSMGMLLRRRCHPVVPFRELNALGRAEVARRLEQRGYRIERRRHYQLTLPVPMLMHVCETKGIGFGSALLLGFNKAAHALDRCLGSPFGVFFDSYILVARKPGPSVA